MKTYQSELLTQFYQAYFKWVSEGAEEDIMFSRSYGLCFNIRVWVTRTMSLNSIDSFYDLQSEMEKQFNHAGLAYEYPFGGQGVYNEEQTSGTLHQNKQRLAWVQSHC